MNNEEKYGYYDCKLSNPLSEKNFEEVVVPLVKSLKIHKDNVNDYLIVDFDYEHGGKLNFVQVAVDDDGLNYDFELARFEKNLPENEPAYKTEDGRKYKLYLHEPYEKTDLATVLELLRLVLVENKCPDISDWRDISYLAEKE